MLLNFQKKNHIAQFSTTNNKTFTEQFNKDNINTEDKSYICKKNLALPLQKTIKKYKLF